MLLIFGGGGVGGFFGYLVSELAVAERVSCLFGSCGWAAGVHALGARLGPCYLPLSFAGGVPGVPKGWWQEINSLCDLEAAQATPSPLAVPPGTPEEEERARKHAASTQHICAHHPVKREYPLVSIVHMQWGPDIVSSL